MGHNFRKKLRNFKPELKNSKKNLKPNELPELRSKNNDLSCPENSKSFLNDLKRLAAPPPNKSNSTNDEKLRWLNFDEILKNLTWPTNPLFPTSERNKPTRSPNCLKPLTTFNESNKSSKKKNPKKKKKKKKKKK